MELWWPLSGLSAWLNSGAAMFLLFNVLVGAIAVMSRGQAEQGGRGRRLCRCASSMVLDRLRSFSSVFSFVHPAAAEWGDYRTTPEPEGEMPVGEAAPEQQAALEPLPGVRDVAAYAYAPASTPETGTDEKRASFHEQDVQGPPAELPRAAASAGVEGTAAVMEGEGNEQPTKEAPAEPRGKRRARARRREAEEALEGKEELNARAELFIHQFREDLRLQRLNSIINYTRAFGRRAGAVLSQE